MKLNKYQTVYDIVNAVCSLSDVEELKRYIAESDIRLKDDDTEAHLIACKEALRVYEQGFYRRWSTLFLETKLEECQQQNEVRDASIYEAEIRSRKA